MIQETYNFYSIVLQSVIAVAAILGIIQIVFLMRNINILQKQVAVSQYQAAMNMLFDWRSDIIREPELAERYKSSEYFRKAFDDAGSVKEYFHTMKIFHILSFLYFVDNIGEYNKYMWGDWKEQVRILMTPEKNRILWKRAKIIGLYSKNFKIAVEDIIEEIEKNLLSGNKNEDKQEDQVENNTT